MKNNHGENRILGIIGALVGGMIATIPWILVYIYGNMMFSALAIIIAFVALKGYQFCKGKQDKYLPIIISVVSIISVSVATLIIIPLAILSKNGYDVSFYNLKILYNSSKFTSAILRDYIIAVLFTVLGISGIIKNLKLQVANPKVTKEEQPTETK